jgi:transcriptional regulator with XRE-family HTH domain
MGTISERIAFLIKNQDLTQAKFADLLHLTQAYVSRICSGAKQPSDRTISDICRVFSVSEAWLRDGVGEMYVRRSANEELAILVNDLMSDADESFRKRFVSLLLALPPESWAAIEDFAKKLQKNTED